MQTFCYKGAWLVWVRIMTIFSQHMSSFLITKIDDKGPHIQGEIYKTIIKEAYSTWDQSLWLGCPKVHLQFNALVEIFLYHNETYLCKK